MKTFRRGQPIASLPRTVRNLVVVARHFGVRYTWNDCLCILQDVIEDWKVEAPRIRDAFANSTCNVLAPEASDPDGVLFMTVTPSASCRALCMRHSTRLFWRDIYSKTLDIMNNVSVRVR
ncbi:Putative heterokaryon incompatibility [Colletotrichum destructivum]|uniref:Heterokaryon incompatibility n=1 Tax=Colletotrichum destructivum TaxID=34406 RepID=A0AAX4HVT5_9PEZI|nr:Putative heterokaryon incompatibility [Colletotrichum destructivum]